MSTLYERPPGRQNNAFLHCPTVILISFLLSTNIVMMLKDDAFDTLSVIPQQTIIKKMRNLLKQW